MSEQAEFSHGREMWNSCCESKIRRGSRPSRHPLKKLSKLHGQRRQARASTQIETPSPQRWPSSDLAFGGRSSPSARHKTSDRGSLRQFDSRPERLGPAIGCEFAIVRDPRSTVASFPPSALRRCRTIPSRRWRCAAQVGFQRKLTRSASGDCGPLTIKPPPQCSHSTTMACCCSGERDRWQHIVPKRLVGPCWSSTTSRVGSASQSGLVRGVTMR